MKVIRRIAAVSRRAVVRATEAVHHPAVGVTTLALATAFALASVVNALDIGWPWWLVASVFAVVALGLGWGRPLPGWFALMHLATAFALASVVNELDIGWPWWVVASVVAVVAAGLSRGVYSFSKRRWYRYREQELEWYRALEPTRRARESTPHVDYTLPHKRTPPIAVIVGLFAVSLGSLGMSTSLDDSSPGSIVAYAVPLWFGALSFVMGLMLARARRKALDVIRENFVRQVETALTLDTLSLDSLVTQRNTLLDSGDVSDANNIIVLIRDYYRLREDLKRRRTPPPVTW